jgi:cation:H+ antiporter
MTTYLLQLLAGVVLAWFGGEWFVRGAVGLAAWARWPAAVIGSTVAAFGTSSPELFVAISAAREGLPQLSFGDVLGSSVVNIALVLGIVLMIGPMKARADDMGRDVTFALAAALLVALLSMDGHLSRVDGGIMMGVFFAWLGLTVQAARKHVSTEEPTVSRGKAIAFTIAGLAVLIAASQFVVLGGKGLATALGWSPFIVGAVVLAVATSTPELATTLVAKLRGHDEMGLGNVLGSNVFNTLFIAGVVVLIRPFDISFREIELPVAAAVFLTLMIWPIGGILGRARGVMLLAMYAAFIYMSLHLSHGSSH